MRLLTVITLGAVLPCFSTVAAESNAQSDAQNRQPLYRITIVSRTTKAINYGYLSAPTGIDFAGTPLLPGARGDATVDPGRGATEVTAHFSDVPPPSKFGPQYLTYVVWAISPEGRAQNLGELMLDASNKGTLKTSVPMQTFALIVTAEPYYAVTQPSDLVVMENALNPNTIGRVEEVNATYELLPRKPYTYDPDARASTAPPRKPVSKAEYDAIVALYQAQNAIQIAESQDAARYAPERLNRARQLYEQARAYPGRLTKDIVSLAREATQIAEDSRAIAVKRASEQAAAEQQRLQSQQSAERAAREAEREQAVTRGSEAERSVAPAAPAPSAQEETAGRDTAPADAPIVVSSDQFKGHSPRTTENRRQLLSTLDPYFETRDTPRGIVVTVREPLANSPSLHSYLARLSTAIRPYRNLHLEVDANSDRANDIAATARQAERMREALIAAGVSPGIVMARGLGNGHPIASNATEAGRSQNRRIEIVIAGDAIGRLATWDRTYNVAPSADVR